jgi:hypothetical protein
MFVHRPSPHVVDVDCEMTRRDALAENALNQKPTERDARIPKPVKPKVK